MSDFTFFWKELLSSQWRVSGPSLCFVPVRISSSHDIAQISLEQLAWVCFSLSYEVFEGRSIYPCLFAQHWFPKINILSGEQYAQRTHSNQLGSMIWPNHPFFLKIHICFLAVLNLTRRKILIPPNFLVLWVIYSQIASLKYHFIQKTFRNYLGMDWFSCILKV